MDATEGQLRVVHKRGGYAIMAHFRSSRDLACQAGTYPANNKRPAFERRHKWGLILIVGCVVAAITPGGLKNSPIGWLIAAAAVAIACWLLRAKKAWVTSLIVVGVVGVMALALFAEYERDRPVHNPCAPAHMVEHPLNTPGRCFSTTP
jgi:hypothetical protein